MEALDQLIERYVTCCREQHVTGPAGGIRQPFDPEWPSPCQLGSVDDDGIIEWLPLRREEPPDFSGIERALERPLHPDIKHFFGRYYSDLITGRTVEGGVQLIQPWSDADFDRLLENSIGHAMAKTRARDPMTWFFATTDEDEYFLSLDDASGAVLLERVGHPPLREVAPDLSSFLDRVEPEFVPHDQVRQ